MSIEVTPNCFILLSKDKIKIRSIVMKADPREIEFYEWNTNDAGCLLLSDRSTVLDSLLVDKLQIGIGTAQLIERSTRKYDETKNNPIIKLVPDPDYHILYLDPCRNNSHEEKFHNIKCREWEMANTDDFQLKNEEIKSKSLKETLLIDNNTIDFLKFAIQKLDKNAFNSHEVKRFTKIDTGEYKKVQEMYLQEERQINVFQDKWEVNTETVDLEVNETLDNAELQIPKGYSVKPKLLSVSDLGAVEIKLDLPLLTCKKDTFNFASFHQWKVSLPSPPVIKYSSFKEIKNATLAEELDELSMYKMKVPQTKQSWDIFDRQSTIPQFTSDPWEISKVKMATMNWRPFGQISKDKILYESSEVSKLDLKIPIVYSSRVTRVKMDEMKLIRKELETISLITKYSDVESTQTDIGEELKTTYDQDILSQLTTNGTSDFPTQHEQSSKNIVLSLSKRSGNNDENNDKGPASQDLAILSKKEQDQSKQTIESPVLNYTSSDPTSLIDSLVQQKRRKISKQKEYRLLANNYTNGFPILDALNYSTNMLSKKPDTNVEKTINNNSGNTILATTFLNSLNDVSTETPTKPKDGSSFLFDSSSTDLFYRQIALSYKMSSKYPELVTHLQQYADNPENRTHVYEIQSDETQNNFDMFISETCGVLFVTPIKAYQVDVITGELKIFKAIEDIVIHVQSLIVVVLTEEKQIQHDCKLQEFGKTCTHLGITVKYCGPKVSQMEVCISELINKYGSIFQPEGGSGKIPSFEFSDEHFFLFNCGFVNPIIVDYILRCVTVDDFISMGAIKREELFREVISGRMLQHLSTVFQIND